LTKSMFKVWSSRASLGWSCETLTRSSLNYPLWPLPLPDTSI